MKAKHTYPSGQTSASKIKALLLCLEAKKGAKSVDALLAKLRLARTDFDDETRLFPLSALRNAIEFFNTELPDSLDEVAPFLVVPENLGVWARVLRGTRSPEEAFARIDSSDSEHGRSTRWETIASRPGHWHGSVRIGHDPKIEKDGLLARLRAVELAVVPLLFGFSRGVVSKLKSTDEKQEFEVAWSLPTPTRGVAIGAGVGALAGGATLAAHASLVTAGVALAIPLIAGACGLVWARDRARRVETSAQSMRVSALERSLALRETEDRAGAGDLEGSVIAGQYRIGARMGSGASGVIYEATRIGDGTPVAIKLLRAATAHDAVASDRLRREAEALGLSWHPNVVEVIDHGHLPDGTSYLVMELLEGETLATRLKTKHRLSPEEILPLAIQVTEAVVAIHAAGVVHRDLKPSNIYIVHAQADAGNDEELVKVFDFGIARVEWEEMRITNMGAPMGTPGYMSPEQESGGEVDARSDVFAIGAVIYECLVGEPPPPSLADMWTPGKRPPSSFAVRIPPTEPESSGAQQAASGVHPASRRMPSAAPSPLESGPIDERSAEREARRSPQGVSGGEGSRAIEVPSSWKAIVERALAKRVEDRFQDARALLSALRALRPKTTSESAPPVASES